METCQGCGKSFPFEFFKFFCDECIEEAKLEEAEEQGIEEGRQQERAKLLKNFWHVSPATQAELKKLLD